ncbi:MAG: GTPase ObgE [Phycisphaerae bacterium]
MFVDEAEIYLRGGNGGNGCVAFTRERFRPKGGPSGGTGGRGGSVYAEATAGIDTLLDFAGRHHWIAENGRPGEGNQRAGRSGEDLVVQLPPGTLIYDRDSGALLKDLTEIGERVCLAAGGAGGRGNKSYATPTHQTPTEAEPGQPGEQRRVRLELKLIADIGFVGLPNSGKSTLLSALSKATPKIAPYPFTTLKPQLGIAELTGYRRLVLADIPGLIEGAHEGSGLGDAFLRHIERTRVIVHLIDVAPADGSPSPVEAYHIVRGELAKFSESLAGKCELIVANKMDLDHEGHALARVRQGLDKEVLGISAATRAGLDELTERMWQLVTAEKTEVPEPALPRRLPPPLRTGS